MCAWEISHSSDSAEEPQQSLPSLPPRPIATRLALLGSLEKAAEGNWLAGKPIMHNFSFIEDASRNCDIICLHLKGASGVNWGGFPSGAGLGPLWACGLFALLGSEFTVFHAVVVLVFLRIQAQGF